MKIDIDISEEQFTRLTYDICADKEISPSQLLGQVVHDLLADEYSGGSDERMKIREWFERSGF